MTTALTWIALALKTGNAAGQIDFERDVYPRARMALSPPPLRGSVLADLDVGESQMNALQDLYDATNASASSEFLNWFRPEGDPLHTHYCNFTGVSCDSELHVITLDLNQTGLSGRIPDSIQNLGRLRRFKVWMNDHFGTIPSVFGELEQLEELILGQNNFVGTIPVELGSAFNLRRLLMQSNDLTGTVPTFLCKLSNLRALDFSRNRGLVGTLPACLGSLPNLRYVRVRDAGFSGEISAELCVLSEYGCDGVACRAGSYQFPHGRQTSNSTPCLACPTTSNLIGRMHCDTGMGDTYMPSASPSDFPSTLPSVSPSALPTAAQSASPSTQPRVTPSTQPSISPSSTPTSAPTTASGSPSESLFPSAAPSLAPTYSLQPSSLSFSPSHGSEEPTHAPSQSPSDVEAATESLMTSFSPSPAPSLDTLTSASSSAPTRAPTISPSHPEAGPSASPTTESSGYSLSPSSDSVVGGLKQGGYEDFDSPKKWTLGVLVVMLCTVACCLVSLFTWRARRKSRNNSEQGDSIGCLPDDDSGELPRTPPPEPIDPFSFPEVREQVTFRPVFVWVKSCTVTRTKLNRILFGFQNSLHDSEEGVARRPHSASIEYIGAASGHAARTAGPSSPLDFESEVSLCSIISPEYLTMIVANSRSNW